jgi:hypothetical protein
VSTMTFTIEVDRSAVTAADWRDDPRWDQLYEFAVSLFPGHDVHGSGELLHDTEQV